MNTASLSVSEQFARDTKPTFEQLWRAHVEANRDVSFSSLREMLIKRGAIIPHASRSRNWRITHMRTLCVDGVWR